MKIFFVLTYSSTQVSAIVDFYGKNERYRRTERKLKITFWMSKFAVRSNRLKVFIPPEVLKYLGGKTE